jgi:sugar diacid utilization regulator/putative methionine-R-sulfoxide reductase with GAF domain
MECFLRHLLSATTVSAAAQAAVDTVRETMSADISWCGITDDGVLTMGAHSGLRTTEMMSAWSLKVGEGIGGRTAKEGRVHWVRDYRKDPRRVPVMKSVIDQEDIRGAICAPLTSGADVLGVIYAAQRGLRDWTPEETQLISGIGRDTGVALGNIMRRQRERTEADDTRRAVQEANRTVEAITAMATSLGHTDDIGAGIGVLAHRLGLTLDLVDVSGEVLRTAPPTADAEEPVRWELPIGDYPLGVLRIRGHRMLSTAEKDLVAIGTDLISLQLMRARASLHAELRLRSEFLNDLLVGPVEDRQGCRERAALLGIDLGTPRYVACIGVHGTGKSAGRVRIMTRSSFDAVERRIRSHFPGSIIIRRGGGAVALLPPGDADLQKVRSLLRNAAGDGAPAEPGLAAGIGRLCVGLDDYASSHTEACLGLDIARQRPRAGEVISAGDLGLYGLLARGSAHGSLESIVENALGPLLEADADGGSEYVKTLDAYLASDRHLERTAATLHVHVNTVRYRLAKVQEKLGVDLHDVDTRFLLELALRVQAALNRS